MATVETLGKYEIKRQLGRGAMGTVYEGWDPIIERRVAVKTVNLPDASDPETEEALARFRREAQAAGRLTHPNIVGVFDYGETGDVAYIVMEYIDGPPLKTLMDKQDRFTIANTVRIMGDLLAGLKFSHDRGVVHRDIKPSNIMLTSEGQAKIADFGIARIESSSMTQAGTVLGTPAYMSPEQIMGQVVDARSDIYSSGVLLYQLLTGERPFEGGMSAIMHKALNTEPPLPSQISVSSPTPFDGVVRKAMAKRPEDRFANAAEFANAIRNASEGRPLVAQEPDQEATMVAAPRSGMRPAAPAARPIGQPTAPPAGSAAVVAIAPAKKSALPLVAGVVVVLLALLGGGGAYFYLNRSVPTPVPGPGPTPAPLIPPAVVVAPTPPTPVLVLQQPPESQPLIEPPPAPDPTSATNLDALRSQIAQLVGAQQCVAVDGDLSPTGTATIRGAAAPPAPNALRNALAGMAIPGGINWQVVGVDPLYCPTLDAVKPIMLAYGAKTPGLTLGLADGRTLLRDGERIRPHLVMADFKGPLRVDYVAHDGNVQHLYPQIADSKLNVVGESTTRAFAAGEAVNLGDVSPGHPAWEVGEPYGVDMIIAIQSAQPLFDRPRPSNVETVADYLRDLRAAVESAQHRGVRVIGNVLMVDTVAK